MNRGEMRDFLRSLTGIETTSVYADAELDDFLNRAYERFYNLAEWHPWREVVSAATVAATATVDFGATYSRFVSVWLLDGTGAPERALNQRTEQEMRRRAGYRATSGKPFAWARATDSTVTLFPTPDDAYDLRATMLAALTTFTADGDLPAWTYRNLDTVVPYLAAHELLEIEGDDPDRVAWAQNQAALAVGQAARFLLDDGVSVEYPARNAAYTGRGLEVVPPVIQTGGGQ